MTGRRGEGREEKEGEMDREGGEREREDVLGGSGSCKPKIFLKPGFLYKSNSGKTLSAVPSPSTCNGCRAPCWTVTAGVDAPGL